MKNKIIIIIVCIVLMICSVVTALIFGSFPQGYAVSGGEKLTTKEEVGVILGEMVSRRYPESFAADSSEKYRSVTINESIRYQSTYAATLSQKIQMRFGEEGIYIVCNDGFLYSESARLNVTVFYDYELYLNENDIFLRVNTYEFKFTSRSSETNIDEDLKGSAFLAETSGIVNHLRKWICLTNAEEGESDSVKGRRSSVVNAIIAPSKSDDGMISSLAELLGESLATLGWDSLYSEIVSANGHGIWTQSAEIWVKDIPSDASGLSSMYSCDFSNPQVVRFNASIARETEERSEDFSFMSVGTIYNVNSTKVGKIADKEGALSLQTVFDDSVEK